MAHEDAAPRPLDVSMPSAFPSRPGVLWHWDGTSWCPVSPDRQWYWESRAFAWKRVPAEDAVRLPSSGRTFRSRVANLPRWLKVAWPPSPKFSVTSNTVAATLPVVQKVMQDAPFPAVNLSLPLQGDAVWLEVA